MLLDMHGERIECALHFCAIAFMGGGDAELRKESAAEIIRCKQPMQITAMHAPVRGDCAFRCAVNKRKRPHAILPFGPADMDFIGLDSLLRLGMRGLDERKAFLGANDGSDSEQPEPRRLAGRSLDAVGVVDAFAE